MVDVGKSISRLFRVQRRRGRPHNFKSGILRDFPGGIILGESEEQRVRRERVAKNNLSSGKGAHTLTPEFVDAMVDLVKRCLSPACSAALLNVSRTTFERWMAKGEQQTRGQFQQFRDRVKCAEGMAEAFLVSIVRGAAVMQPELALEMLSRMNPDDWAPASAPETNSEVLETLERTHENAYRELMENDQEARQLAGQLTASVKKTLAKRQLVSKGKK